jgi:hypothetical protein
VPFLAEEEEVVHPDRWVPLSEGEVERRGYRFGEKVSGPRVDAVTGPNRSLRPFSIFSLFLLLFFYFLISFITFANLVQIASNQLCKVSKIPSNIPEQ